MLFSLNKHYIKNFKNFLISHYLLTSKQLFFKKIIHIKISFSNKSFFIASFLLYTFCFIKYKYSIKKHNLNIILPIFNFFFNFNIFFYPFLLNNNFFKKKTKTLISFKFLFSNFFLIPVSFFFYKTFRWLNKQNIEIKFLYFFKKNIYKYIQFFLNFFQLPVFLMLSNSKND